MCSAINLNVVQCSCAYSGPHRSLNFYAMCLRSLLRACARARVYARVHARARAYARAGGDLEQVPEQDPETLKGDPARAHGTHKRS